MAESGSNQQIRGWSKHRKGISKGRRRDLYNRGAMDKVTPVYGIHGSINLNRVFSHSREGTALTDVRKIPKLPTYLDYRKLRNNNKHNVDVQNQERKRTKNEHDKIDNRLRKYMYAYNG